MLPSTVGIVPQLVGYYVGIQEENFPNPIYSRSTTCVLWKGRAFPSLLRGQQLDSVFFQLKKSSGHIYRPSAHLVHFYRDSPDFISQFLPACHLAGAHTHRHPLCHTPLRIPSYMAHTHLPPLPFSSMPLVLLCPALPHPPVVWVATYLAVPCARAVAYHHRSHMVCAHCQLGSGCRDAHRAHPATRRPDGEHRAAEKLATPTRMPFHTHAAHTFLLQLAAYHPTSPAPGLGGLGHSSPPRPVSCAIPSMLDIACYLLLFYYIYIVLLHTPTAHCVPS